MTAWEPLLRALRDRTGFALGPERLPEVEAAARRAMALAGMDDLTAWIETVAAGRASMAGIIDDLMVGETYFFREPVQLGLVEALIPTITTPISLWSAGCASGEEAYTLAMIAHELGAAGRTRIVGTDISGVSLKKARGGQYQEWSLRGPSAQRARAWLTSDGRPRPTYTIDPRLRAAVTFEALNLVSDPFPPQQDVIFCRNVFIYLQPPVIAAIAHRFHDALVEGGWLVLASSDPPLGPPFETVRTEHGVVYRRIAHPLPPVPRPPGGVSPPLRRAAAPRPAPAPAPPPPPPRPTVDPVAAVRALADQGDLAAAERAAGQASAASPMNAELHYLHAVLLVELGRSPDAITALRRALYLDPRFVMAWMTLGTTLRATGNAPAARRAFQSARRLCASRSPEEPLPMADGATAAYLGRVAAREEARP